MSRWSVGSKIGKGSFASVYVGTYKVSVWLPFLCIRPMSMPPSREDLELFDLVGVEVEALGIQQVSP